MGDQYLRKQPSNLIPKVDEGHIQYALSVILEPGNVSEIRVPQTRRGTISGYFNDYAKLSHAAANLSGKASGVYMTLNPVNAALLSRSVNHTTDYAKHTTSDNDIDRLRFLLIDIDAKRPAGISSTDSEHQSALNTIEEIEGFLVSLGFPEGAMILGDSGNGGHILVRIDLSNSIESVSILQKCLTVLDMHFSDDMVSVDLTTYNPARISKIYGTLAAKGDSTLERPHRLAKLIKVPALINPVTIDVIQRLAMLAPVLPMSEVPSDAGKKFDLASWITEHNLKIMRTGPWNGGTKWILQMCPWNQEHRHGEAYIVQFSSGAIAAGCHHSSCHSHGWRELRALYESTVKSNLLSKSRSTRPRVLATIYPISEKYRRRK